MKLNNRLNKIGDYGFTKIQSECQSLLNLGVGDPDLKVHPNILRALIKALEEENFNKYPIGSGSTFLKDAVIRYYQDKYNVDLTREEVIILLGSKDGISKIFGCCCDHGDTAIIPGLGYPVYSSICKIWGLDEYQLPLMEKNNYLPVLENIPEIFCRESKLFMINYPNNPTGAVADSWFYRDIVKYCSKYDIILCNDGAYNEIVDENTRAVSLLQYDNSKNSVEFGTFSKIYNMCGFRIGYAVGNKYVIKLLEKLKDNCDSGQFRPIQRAAEEALKLDDAYKKGINMVYDQRRKLVKSILKIKNLNFYDGKGTFYIWCKVPVSYTTDEFCIELAEKYGIITTPGYYFGNSAQGFFRISLTQNSEKLEAYLNKLKVYNIN